jgi:DNA ligase-1
MQVEKLKECLTNLALRSGFDTFEDFVKYKEKNVCAGVYKAVYPEIQVISTTDDKTYVDNLKVMTAQNLYDNKTGDIIKLTDELSKKLNISAPPIGWWASEKWDGIRALWDGEKMISRGSGVGKPKVYTYVPEWFKNTLPPGIPLDGEIWIGRGLFQKTSRLSTIKPGKSYTAEQIENIWAGDTDPPVVFKVFDIPNDPRPFERRMAFLQTIVKDRKVCWNKLAYPGKKLFPLQFTEQVKIKTMEQLMNLYTKLTSEGAEGIMLRASGSPYQTKRSKYMLKYKIKEDSECILREYIPGDGKYIGMLGSLKCELMTDGKPNGIFTQIGTGLNDAQRENYNNPNSSDFMPVGSVISFSYMEMTNEGVPRHPVYRGIRDDMHIQKKMNVPVKDVKKILSKLIAKIVSEKEANWTFKVKSYKQANEILKDSMNLNLVEDYIRVLREGDMKLAGEENFKAKNGTWKSSILQKIDSILKTGQTDGISLTEQDQRSLAIENLTKVPNIGPSTAAKIYDAEEITTVEELKYLYSVNKDTLNEKQAIGLKHYEDLMRRIPRKEMDAWNEKLIEIFKETMTELGTTGELILAGSYRRKTPDSGDIDALITTDVKNSRVMNTFYNNLVKRGVIEKTNTLAKGPTKIMAVARIDEYYRHLDIFYHPRETFPFAILFTTGSKEFNVKMRKFALDKRYSLNEQNLTKKSPTGTKVTQTEYLTIIEKEFPETERDIFDFLGYPYIPPEMR